MAGKKRFAEFKKNTLPKIKRTVLKGAVIVLILHIGQIALYKWVAPPITLTQWHAVLEGFSFEREHVSLNEISPHLQLAVISAEDQLFAQHNGFDLDSITKAIHHNQKGGSVRGASTISQQTAKNIFLWQGRSWLRKGLEVYYTFVMEKLYGKKRILELYLNEAEMGPGIFGAQAAARHYFDKSASDLNRRESALIASCLPNPKKYSPTHPQAHTQKKTRWVLSQMTYLGTRPNTRKLLYEK
ncbi:MAG: monofunctional biosynthetic peptidoglycan transglycosylase [Deltaproteobacteria bacterium]|nr:monofunctional biosynthetic peptidoglycan transglycosylase [Deltaproteobacteria bacterium]MBN2672179.1 monofunctional biosynthetic peptidoglycan transglycosylase [Deltaproteobacteria bacterium]